MRCARHTDQARSGYTAGMALFRPDRDRVTVFLSEEEVDVVEARLLLQEHGLDARQGVVSRLNVFGPGLDGNPADGPPPGGRFEVSVPASEQDRALEVLKAEYGA